MGQYASKYSIELVTPSGTLLADLTGRALNRKIIKSRNEADEITWSIDLNEFEKYCRLRGVDPRTVIINGVTEVRIKRGQTYLAGGQIVYHDIELSDKQVINIRADGFLNLFKSRYTDAPKIYTATQATTIAWNEINATQLKTNGNYGVTRGLVATVGVHDRTYNRDEIKTLIQNLTKLETGTFDFEFTYDKVFNTYASIGSSRPDIIFQYPGNLKRVAITNDATGLANSITVLGQGTGSQTLSTVTSDTSSQLSYKLREKIITANNVSDVTTLTDQGNSELDAWSFPIELPGLEVDANKPPFITDYSIGDTVRVRIKGYAMVAQIDAMYRLEKYELNIDDNDQETATLFVSAV